jgi:hypothetical protein
MTTTVMLLAQAGKTALELAASAGHIETTETLLCATAMDGDDLVSPMDSPVMEMALSRLKRSTTRAEAAQLLKASKQSR